MNVIFVWWVLAPRPVSLLSWFGYAVVSLHPPFSFHLVVPPLLPILNDRTVFVNFPSFAINDLNRSEKPDGMIFNTLTHSSPSPTSSSSLSSLLLGLISCYHFIIHFALISFTYFRCSLLYVFLLYALPYYIPLILLHLDAGAHFSSGALCWFSHSQLTIYATPYPVPRGALLRLTNSTIQRRGNFVCVSKVSLAGY